MKTTLNILRAAMTGLALFAATAFGATYGKYATITVCGVPADTTLTDFPLLVRISASRPDGFSYDDMLTDDHTDLRFEDANGNGLAYDIDTWNPDGESLVWVKVPTLEKDDEITMRWGCLAPDANDPTGVWSNYVFVWHGNDTTTDSTGRTRSIAPTSGGFAVTDSESSHLGSCFKNETTANNKKFNVTSNPFAQLTSYSQFAVSGWIKPAMTEPNIRIFSTKQEHSKDGMEFLAVTGSGIFLRGKGGSAGGNQIKWTDGYLELKKQAWTFVSGVIDGTDGRAFANNLIETTDKLLAPESAGNGFAICGYAGADYSGSTQGCVDEIRLYDGIPADAYLTAEWAQVVSNDYVSVSAATSTDSSAAEIADAPVVVRNQDGTYTISATFTGTSGETYDVAFQLNGTDYGTQSVTLGAAETEKSVSWTTDGNVADGTYLARVVVTIGTSVAQKSADGTFLVGDIGFGTCTNAYEEGLVSGAFVLTRPGDAIQPLTVSYAVASATATAGTSYQAISGTATFAAGDSSVSIPVVPLNDPSLAADATLTLALSAGHYGIAQGSESASVTLVNWATPSGYNVWIAQSGSDGLASTAANWSEGRAPVDTDKILLGAWSQKAMTWDAAATHSVASWKQTADYTGTVTFPITYEGADVDAGFNLFTVSGDVELLGGHWAHLVQGDSSKTSAEPVERYRLNVAVSGDFAISNGVNVSAQGRGRGFWVYNTNKGWSGRGVYGGYVVMDTNTMYSAEADEAFIPYGSILEPLDTGKGITSQTDSAIDIGHGGGAIHIVVSGDFVNEGRVIANGQTSTGTTGGSGGSIYVRASNILGDGSFEAKASNLTSSGAKAAGSGGRISLVATGSNAATSSTASAAGGRSFGWWQRENLIQEGAAGTVWLQSGADKTLLVRNVVDNWTDGAYHDLGPYVRAYTPIPADDDTASFRAAAAGAELYAASNARIRLVRNVRFAALKVRTESGSLAHIDLCGRKLVVDRVIDSGDTVIVDRQGTYTLADALARGWTWFEDSSATLNEDGTGVLVVGGQQATCIIMR